MDYKSLLLFLSFLSLTYGSAVVIPTVEVLQGPSSKTTLHGPDGSSVSSVSPGGTVVTDGQAVVPVAPILAAGPEIVVSGPAGSIATSHTLAGPAVVPVAAPALPLAVAAVNEGDYIPDNSEKVYDDGSYKGE